MSFVLDLLVEAGLTRRPQTLPFRSIGSLFKGRAPLMEQLEAATRPVALIGQGGVGKTRLAIEHAWKQVVRRPVVLLVSADSPEALNRNLAGLCGPQALDLPEKGEREEAPQLAAGQVAITTRLSNWSAAVQGMAVDVLEPVDAREFLLERTVARRQKSDDDATTAGTIAVDEYPFMDWLSAFKCRMVVQEVPGQKAVKATPETAAV